MLMARRKPPGFFLDKIGLMSIGTVEHPTTEAAFAVNGMDCASCVAHVEKAARKVGGVQDAQVNLARGRAVVQFDPAQTDVSKIAAAISHSGYVATPEDAETTA